MAPQTAEPHHTGRRPTKKEAARPLELWGGIEATVNRAQDCFFDQIERSGHSRRIADLDLIAGLGIRTLRYPVLWERVAPDGLERANWSWSDERLARLRELGVSPIAGLVHHGSGPRHTNLLDPAFAYGLATYARAVAERYPWIEYYTPVNEPLTTARFSALYGHWYPHAKDGLAFAQALVNESRATVLAMRAIREVNPSAKLVQTEDMGKTHSTARLAYQAEFENERRWLTFDLLCGRIAPGHRMWQFLTWLGLPEAELTWFLENPCPPDILGINHYLTSERFLDAERHKYPPSTHGGNGRDRYADVEAVRVRKQGIEGPGALLLETWKRYGIPVAVTEAHLSSTREEQMRWLLEVWRGAQAARGAGADIRAVTVWSLFGAYDWNSLVTCDAGYYEPGAFDLRSPEPRATALTWIIRELAAGREPQHPVLQEPGWWRRPRTRVLYQPVASVQPRGKLAIPQRRFSMRPAPPPALVTEVEPPAVIEPPVIPPAFLPSFPELRAGQGRSKTQPMLITGKTGTLGRAFARLCDLRAIVYRQASRQDMDITRPESVEAFLDAVRPWAVVNTAGYVRVDQAEAEPEQCFRENTEGPAILAKACAERGIPLVTFSSDLVFDGVKAEPYVESDPTAPLNVYGRSKAEAERRVLEAHPNALVIRTSAFFGPWDEYNFVTVALRELAAERPFIASSDQTVSPTYVPDLVNTSLDLLLDGERGIWHLANDGTVTWYELAEMAAEMAGIDPACVVGMPTGSQQLAAARPAYTVLGSERGAVMPRLEAALESYLRECRIIGASWLSRPEPARRVREAKIQPKRQRVG
ncbi:MAG TPA: family 1 glycosylhydrolase [Chloroflexota bacterium]|nr:family 1 glycosylhydrolase [Chloroflexota bacterium]